MQANGAMRGFGILACCKKIINMATVNMNFRSDMVRIMRDEMSEMGFKTKNVSDEHELMMYYFTINKRLVKKTPRTVHESQGLIIPPHRKDGYILLKEKFQRGESIIPHLSKQILGYKFPDKMLFDWDINHFHLGTTIKADGFVDQHDEIVYAIVTDRDVYVIDILEHEHWYDISLLEKVLVNWPALLSTFRVDGTPVSKFSQEEFTSLRNSNINIMLTLSDGHGYLGRGLGVTTAGTSADAVMQANRMIHDLQAMERWCNNQLLPLSEQYTFKLSLTRIGNGIYISDPQMGVLHQVFDFPSLK